MQRCCSTAAQPSPRRPCTCRAPTSSTACSRSPTARRACWAACSRCSTTAVLPAPATYRSCRSTRASSTRPARRSRPTRSISTPRTSSSWRSRAAATRSPRRSACSARSSRKYAHRIPFILKFNHNEFLSYPNAYDQIRFASIKQAFDMGVPGRRRDDLLRLRGIEAADPGSVGDVPAGARARDVHGALVLPAQRGVQDQGEGLPRRRRPDADRRITLA